MSKDFDKVIIRYDSDGDRYYECPKCGGINYLCQADESGMKDDCIYCLNTVIIEEEKE